MINWRTEDLLIDLNFPDHIISILMTCITKPNIPLITNGSTEGYFPAERGLRKGDSMSRLIFVLRKDYLTKNLNYVGDCMISNSIQDVSFEEQSSVLFRFSLPPSAGSAVIFRDLWVENK